MSTSQPQMFTSIDSFSHPLENAFQALNKPNCYGKKEQSVYICGDNTVYISLLIVDFLTSPALKIKNFKSLKKYD